MYQLIQWNYIDCFKGHKDEPYFLRTAETLEGFNDLNKEDQTEFKKKILIDTVADCMAFGALEHCPECVEFLIFKLN
ncbi:unnamed protein product, partial [Rotaria sp. Silwood2]